MLHAGSASPANIGQPLFQWKHDGIDIPNANARQLVLANLKAADAGLYAVEIRTVAGQTTSQAARITVTGGNEPVITAQPSGQSLNLGGRINLSVSVTALDPSLTFQWQKDGVEIPGGTARQYILASAQATDAGTYAVAIKSSFGSITSQTAVVSVNAAFVKIASGPVVSSGGDSSGVAWGDYNGDGWIDLFVPNWNRQNNGFYRNNGGTNFTAIATNVSSEGGDSNSAAWADYDNDGHLDLLVANWFDYRDYLYRNTGNGVFRRADNVKPFADDQSLAWTGAWADYDNDGWVDLVVGADSFWGITREANRLYHNLGGTFESISSNPIVTSLGIVSGLAWGDYDNDGLVDLFAAVIGQGNWLYRNLGGGIFERLAEGPVAQSKGLSSNATWGDYDNDGDVDLFIANLFAEPVGKPP